MMLYDIVFMIWYDMIFCYTILNAKISYIMLYHIIQLIAILLLISIPIVIVTVVIKFITRIM